MFDKSDVVSVDAINDAIQEVNCILAEHESIDVYKECDKAMRETAEIFRKHVNRYREYHAGR